MHIGHYISGAGHTFLVGWVLFGGVFQPAPDPFEVTGVDIITAEQFETILAAQRAPAPEAEVQAPVVPETTAEPPQIVSTPDEAPAIPKPEDVTPTEPDPLPQVETPQPPVVVPEPQEPIAQPEPEPEIAAPVQSPRPVARDVSRVAPEAVAPPEPDTRISDVDQAPTQPAETQADTQESQEATAREEAVTEIPTEPQDVAAAPKTSIRPKLRPRPAAQPVARTAEASPEAAAPDTENAVNAALAAALAEAEAPAAPSGPPLTRGEKDGLRIAVQQCWVVDVGSQSADVTVTVGLSLDRDGKVVSGSLRMLNAQGGGDAAVRAAFDAARRAIYRCQKTGYKLPIEKYDHWRDVEITFNPEQMRRR